MAILTLKVDDNVLAEAKRVFEEVGLDTNRAINVFLKKCISENAIPFDLTISNNENWAKMLAKNENEEEVKKIIRPNIDDEDIEELAYEGLDV